MNSSLFHDIALDSNQSSIVKKYFLKKKMSQMWDYIDSLKIKLPENKEVEIVYNHKGALVRVWKI